MYAADILAAILDLQHCMQMGHIRSIPCEARHTIGAKKYIPKSINSEVMAVFMLFLFAAAILAAILNISISPRVPEWHQPDSV